jgi:aminopeptidase N
MKGAHKFAILFFVFTSILTAQNYQERFNTIDVQHYKLTIAVNDTNNSIDATMQVTLKFKKKVDQFQLDLIKKDSISGKGMVIDAIFQNNVSVSYEHTDNNIIIQPKHPFLGIAYTYTISYRGIPKDGLIIGKNIHGDRTFFGDNWPNRAQNWFPCVDHPSDKATIEYLIKTPNHYQAIANGYLAEETDLSHNFKLYHWKSPVPLPTKIMVIGIAQFAVENLGDTHCVPVSTWVYPKNKEQGFYDFSIAKNILTFFIENLGDYPYQKLANVQSKTRFGGMENANTIFYPEGFVTGEGKNKNTIVHEIAHQWFGNSATEIDWPHIWLSEGFANYFTDLYILENEGDESFQKRMQDERAIVLNYFKRIQSPVVGPLPNNYMRLLNANTYQKGAWVLHMLRKEIGNETFWNGIRAYYQKYKFKNASTTDFKNVMAEVSGKNLDIFFDQWLYKTGHPILKTNWIYHDDKVRLIVDQLQDTNFEFLLDLELIYSNGTSEIKTINVQAKSAPFVIETNGAVKDIKLDPNTQLLFEMESM